jgi:glucose/arabinose dehydrogenase
MGDGGSGGDPLGNAQNDDVLLGKLLRMNVRVPSDSTALYTVPPDNPHADRGDRLGLIWAKGLRNPWRFGFDRATGDLYIADVGQGSREEIDVQPAASRGGENYGWRVFEGFACFNPAPDLRCPDQPNGYTMPVIDYGHQAGRCSITGGYVYRGCALPDLRGQYFFRGLLHAVHPELPSRRWRRHRSARPHHRARPGQRSEHRSGLHLRRRRARRALHRRLPGRRALQARPGNASALSQFRPADKP